MASDSTIRGRRGAIDVARVGALVMVVFGHLALAIIDRGPDGELRGANLLALYPDLCAAVVAAGLWAPDRLSTGWWITRPIWFAAVLAVTGLLAAATALGRRLLRRETRRPAPSTVRISLGVAMVTIGAGVIGLLGPRTLPMAALAATAFVAGWWCLGSSGAATPE